MLGLHLTGPQPLILQILDSTLMPGAEPSLIAKVVLLSPSSQERMCVLVVFVVDDLAADVIELDDDNKEIVEVWNTRAPELI